MDIVTRTAGAGDASRIAVLLGQLGYPAGPDDVVARMEYWQADPWSEVMVAEAGGAVAGVAALHAFPMFDRTGRRGRLLVLAVDGDVRGRGVGTALLEAAEDRARRFGCRDMELSSSRYRTGAHRFYERLGYEDACGRSARFVKSL